MSSIGVLWERVFVIGKKHRQRGRGTEGVGDYVVHRGALGTGVRHWEKAPTAR